MAPIYGAPAEHHANNGITTSLLNKSAGTPTQLGLWMTAALVNLLFHNPLSQNSHMQPFLKS
jgi:hypothetical protein